MPCVKTTGVRTDRKVYRPGEKVTVHVDVYNQCAIPQLYKVIVTLNGEEEESAWWIILPWTPDEWLFWLKAPDKEGTYTVTAKTNQEADESLPGKKTVIIVSRRGMKNKGVIIIDSNPQNAGAYVDGRFVGLTPVSVIVNPGVHEILIRMKGYEDYRTRVVVGAGKIVRISVKLKKKPERMWILPLAMGLAGASIGAAVKYYEARKGKGR